MNIRKYKRKIGTKQKLTKRERKTKLFIELYEAILMKRVRQEVLTEEENQFIFENDNKIQAYHIYRCYR